MRRLKKQLVNCYSSRERRMMAWWADVRASALLPLLRLLKKFHVTANGITYLGLIFGLAFVPLLILDRPVAAQFCLLTHALLDGLDGPLARYLKSCSNTGACIDTVCDQTVVASTTLVLIHAHLVSATVGIVYVAVYTLVVLFSMIRSAWGVPYQFLIRPRFLVYLCIPVELYLLPGTLAVASMLLIAPLAYAAAQGLRVILKETLS